MHLLIHYVLEVYSAQAFIHSGGPQISIILTCVDLLGSLPFFILFLHVERE